MGKVGGRSAKFFVVLNPTLHGVPLFLFNDGSYIDNSSQKSWGGKVAQIAVLRGKGSDPAQNRSETVIEATSGTKERPTCIPSDSLVKISNLNFNYT